MSRHVYKIEKNDIFGRYMVAAKPIKQGELILKENPVLVGPQINGAMICFNCCKDLRRTGYGFCLECNTAILCGPKCLGKFHSQEECQHLKNSSIKGCDLAKNEQAILPLRCLLFKYYDEAKWARIEQLEPHLNFRRDSPIWRRHKTVIEDPLRSLKYLTDLDLEQEVIQRVCGALDVNNFEVRLKQEVVNPDLECLRGLYLEAALMTHDCISNTLVSVDDDYLMSIYASVDIPENQLIYFNYANTLQGSMERKKHLREGKYFECQCRRCKDPTEMGTELSSLKCHKCLKGLIRPMRPHELKTNWECQRCKTTFNESLIRLAVAEGRRLVQDVDTTSIAKMEQLVEKLERTFHPQHHLILDVVQNLISLYIRAVPNRRTLVRKIELCQRLLKVLQQIEPGLSRLKAVAMYELQSTEIDLAHKDYRAKEINVEDLINRLVEAESMLKTAAKYLLYEPRKSPEGQIAHNALSELKLLRQSILSIQKDCLSMPPAVNKAESKLKKKIQAVKLPNDQREKDVKSKQEMDNSKADKVKEKIQAVKLPIDQCEKDVKPKQEIDHSKADKEIGQKDKTEDPVKENKPAKHKKRKNRKNK